MYSNTHTRKHTQTYTQPYKHTYIQTQTDIFFEIFYRERGNVLNTINCVLQLQAMWKSTVHIDLISSLYSISRPRSLASI